MNSRNGTEQKQRLSLTLLLAAVYLILYSTLLSRTTAERSAAVLRPFALLVSAIWEKREIFRSLLLNILLFEPFGAALACSLSHEISIGKRVFIAATVGLAFSLMVEYGQYRFSLGNAETDDVICNTLGAGIGALALCVNHIWQASNIRKVNRAPNREHDKGEYDVGKTV